MADFDSRTKLEAFRDHFDTFGKGANYLLIGHGAGFVGCLSVLKEPSEKLPAQFQGLGILVLLFGSGMLLASLFWAIAMIIKIRVTQAIMAQERPGQKWKGWLVGQLLRMLAHTGLWGSMIAFATAVVLIMSRFADAVPPEFR